MWLKYTVEVKFITCFRNRPQQKYWKNKGMFPALLQRTSSLAAMVTMPLMVDIDSEGLLPFCTQPDWVVAYD